LFFVSHLQGLPADSLSVENAIAIFETSQPPLLIDPSSTATEWIKCHLKQGRVEAVNQQVGACCQSSTNNQDASFTTALELAVRFGKTLIVQEVDSIDPILVPVIRKDLVAQGPRFCVLIGEKVL
jgi:dynein heavy chain 2